jgi:hypothetical protein
VSPRGDCLSLPWPVCLASVPLETDACSFLGRPADSAKGANGTVIAVLRPLEFATFSIQLGACSFLNVVVPECSRFWIAQGSVAFWSRLLLPCL